MTDVDKITPDTILEARQARSDRLTKLAHELATKDGVKRKLDEFLVKLDTISDTDVVFRIMTWDHIPVDDAKTKKARMSALDIIDEDDPLLTEYDEEDTTHTKYTKCNFPPFQHFKVDAEGKSYCVGKSHWVGDLETGKWSKDHGQMTSKLAHMFIKLCERYGTRSNWRGYCVDQDTQALTQRGWLDHDQIYEFDKILSFNGEKLVWSNIKSIYRDNNYHGLTHYVTSTGMDSLITPNHKIVTERGLIPIELIKESDRVIVMGAAETGSPVTHYNDNFVELIGWVLSNGHYTVDQRGDIGGITVRKKSHSIKQCLQTLNFEFSEDINNIIIGRDPSRLIANMFPNQVLNLDFILKLTVNQRQKLIDIMTQNIGKRYTARSQKQADGFQALVTLAGHKSNVTWTGIPSSDRLSERYTVKICSPRSNTISAAGLDLNGGKNNGKTTGVIGKGKQHHPNIPTVLYSGTVWCPETEYGCFLARRNGKAYLTGNTYNDEMRLQAILQLSQIGLQFDESKSQNPFAYYTAAITNSFTRVLNIEKRNQNLRDDILEANGLTPSYTRQSQGNWGNGEYSSDE